MTWLELRVPPPIVMVLTALAMAGVAHVVPTPVLALPPAVSTGLALALLIGGSLLVPLGALTFHRARTTSSPLHPARASALVTNGPYRFTRNPMYLGLTTVLAAWALQLHALAAWTGLVVFVAYITRFQIRPEERALRASFGCDSPRSDASSAPPCSGSARGGARRPAGTRPVARGRAPARRPARRPAGIARAYAAYQTKVRRWL